MIVIGGVAFGLSHLIVVVHFRVDWKQVSMVAYLAMLPLVALMGCALWPSFKNFSEKTIACSLYAGVLMTAAASAIGRVCRYPWKEPTGWMCAVGCALMVISDAILLGDEIKRGTGRRNHAVAVMATYLAGEFCLHYGIALDPILRIGKAVHSD
jgi:hypothetical protein